MVQTKQKIVLTIIFHKQINFQAKRGFPDYYTWAFPGKEGGSDNCIVFYTAYFVLAISLTGQDHITSKKNNLFYDGSDSFRTNFNFSLITRMLE